MTDFIIQNVPSTPGPQSANKVYAGPASGSAAAPTFRSLVPADLPLGIVVAAALGMNLN